MTDERLAEAPYDPCGWMVFVWENDEWADNWDCVIHPNETAGRESWAEAVAGGWIAILVKAVPA